MPLSKRAPFIESGGTESSLPSVRVWNGKSPRELCWYQSFSLGVLNESKAMISGNVDMEKPKTLHVLSPILIFGIKLG